MAKKVKKNAKKPTSKAVGKTSAKKKPAAVKRPTSSLTKSPQSSDVVKRSEIGTKPAGSQAGPANPSSSGTKPKAVQVLTRTYLTDAELEHFRQILQKKLHQLNGDVDSIESEVLRKNRADATGDLSSMPIHMADIGSDTFEQDFALGLMSSERKIVAEIIAALKRIQDGTYGICEGTGKPIPKVRLEANPWARYCVEYAARLEKGLVFQRGEARRLAMQTNEDKSKEKDEIESEDSTEQEEQEEHEGEDESEFEPVETDPDLDNLYEIEEEDEQPKEEEHS